jgi:asparagine synthase (glutamine-hydrolysing)
MSRAVAHRGPDGEGAVFIDSKAGELAECAGERTDLMPRGLADWPEGRGIGHDLAFAHRRFAIVDRTPGGHQPYRLKDAPVALAFNGEIYNHIELRAELERLGHVFTTRGDVEVLAHAYLQWGTACFTRLRGFWALALWDGRRAGRPEGALLLSRDPLGKAPLYWTRRGGRLWWSSEIKGLLAAFSESNDSRFAVGAAGFPVREEAVAHFVRSGLRDFGNKTFYEGIETFPRSSWAWVDAAGRFEPKSYWDFPRQRLTASEIGTREAINGLSDRLESAVRLRLRADATVGLELSGGMDSSALAALAALQTGRQPGAGTLSAYTVRFPEPWNETPFAHMVAARYPQTLRLTELAPGNASVLRAIGPFQSHMDEPIHSPNMVAGADIWRQMAGEGIRVSLNGAGGDEVFAGYGGEYLGPFARRLLSQGRLLRAFRELGTFSEREASLLRSSARALWWMVPEGARQSLRPPGPAPEIDPLRTVREVPRASDDFEQRLLDHLTDHKMNYWLRSGNLSFMSVPLEVRLPLLDVDVVEWACRLPGEYLIRDGWMKWVLRKALEKHLPPEVVWRRVKMGFPFPLREWLQASKPGLQALRHGADLHFIDRTRLFEAYDQLAARHPAYLWRCLSVLLWWDNCVQARGVDFSVTGAPAEESWADRLLAV